MQALALEIGFSETVFVLPPRADGTARIRIFNPRHEMPFAGHPTLGAAFVLAAPLQLGVVRLETGVGTVPVVLERDESGRIVFGRMTQPVPRIEAVERPERVLAAVGAARSLLPVELYDNGARHFVVRSSEDASSAGSAPTARRSPTFGVTGVNCVARTSVAWRSRMFWEHGEDPATGSAAGPIACHLARHGLVPLGRRDRDRAGRRDGPPLDPPRARGRRGRARSTRSRSAAAPSSSPAASSGSTTTPELRDQLVELVVGGTWPSGVSPLTTCGTTCARTSAASSSEMPAFCATPLTASSPTTLLISCPVTGLFAPVPTHESACALSPLVLGVLHELGEAPALQEIPRSGASTAARAPTFMPLAAVPAAPAAEEPAQDVLEAAAARGAAAERALRGCPPARRHPFLRRPPWSGCPADRRVRSSGPSLVVEAGSSHTRGFSGERDRRDRGQLDRERRPEAPAVVRDVDPLLGRDRDEVGMLGRDRDRYARGRARRPPLARCGPPSFETTSGGRRSTTATTVEPCAAAATSKRELDRRARRSPAARRRRRSASSSSSRSTATVPRAHATSSGVTGR